MSVSKLMQGFGEDKETRRRGDKEKIPSGELEAHASSKCHPTL
jgi:hypothetical protein